MEERTEGGHLGTPTFTSGDKEKLKKVLSFQRSKRNPMRVKYLKIQMKRVFYKKRK